MLLKEILISPIVNEKSSDLSNDGIYVYKVNKNANKIEIKKAFEDFFKVKVDKCRIIIVKPKLKKNRKQQPGYTSAYKKAIIYVEKKQKVSQLSV